MPDAGGLVIATHQERRSRLRELLEHIRGEARGVLSDDPDSSKRIGEFSRTPSMDGAGAWCPRASTCRGLAVGVYATSASTPLYFAQAIGPLRAARETR